MIRFNAALISTLLMLTLVSCKSPKPPETEVSQTPASKAPETKVSETPAAKPPESLKKDSSKTSKPEVSKTSASPTIVAKQGNTSVSYTAASNNNSNGESLVQIKTHLTALTTAIKSNDFTKAKQEFKEFDELWDKVEDGVKSKSKDAYKEIEDSIDAVKNNALKPAKPDVNKANAAVNSLWQTVEKYKNYF